jgi:hypothetical protein
VEFDPARLRTGEWIVGAGSLALLVATFALPWYGLKPRLAPAAASLGLSTSATGWNALTHVRWLVLICALAGLALVFFQATRRAPALPVSLSVIVSVLGVLTLIALIYRVLINTPGPGELIDRRAGAYIGLFSVLALSYGGYRSMRQEGIAERDGPQQIETLRLEDLPRA